MPVTKSPLRYPGGKTQLSLFVKHLLAINGIDQGVYCEPFSGGAGVAIELLLSNSVSKIILNDIDLGVYSTWRSIVEDKDALISRITDVSVTLDEWKRQKQIYDNQIKSDDYSLDLGFATLFLNRTNHSGIIGGRPIGGLKQDSKYLLDCRFNKKAIIQKIESINALKSRIELYRLDANELIHEVLMHQDPDKLFVFIDPPYYRNSSRLYTNFFKDTDHLQLKESIVMLNNYYWITTYDYEQDIARMYDGIPRLQYKIRYSVNRVRKENEYLFHNERTIVESFDNVVFI